MKLTVDIENTVSKLPSGKTLLDPFTDGNRLVLVCTKKDTGEESSFWFDHSTHSTDNAKELLQEQLDEASVLICHNAQHELVWLWETGFTYDGPVFDTMLVEYLFQKAVKEPLSLQAIAERYDLENQKLDTLSESLKKGMSVAEIAGDELQEYCLTDVRATQELFCCLHHKMFSPEYVTLKHIIGLTNDVCVLLAKIYYRGFRVDRQALLDVKEEFQKEQHAIQQELEEQTHSLMGDTPINLASPEQLSRVVYSRKPRDKATWATNFSRYMKKTAFSAAVTTNSDIVYKTTAIQCRDCFGRGFNIAVKKDGTVGKAKRICRTCNRVGILYIDSKAIAGLRFSAPSASWVANHGFSTSKVNLEILENSARQKGLSDAQSFLHKVRRLSALDTYISSFVEGITNFMKSDGRLHVRLVQHRTATGRLASDSPNLQNMPRGGTFPIKKVFRSRWLEGSIIEADFAQLEFRAAAFLGDDEIAKEEIDTGFDVHSYTAEIISKYGQATTRQEAKAHTFAPLFGATGFGRTAAEAAYYKLFTKKYYGIASWHGKLANEVMSTGMVTTPTGRQFKFPDVKRKEGGTITHFTAVKNYPVQSISTDIVQTALLLVECVMRDKKLNSIIVNSVHDSIVVDVYPKEEQLVRECITIAEQKLRTVFFSNFKVNFSVPLIIDCKMGKNWMELNEYA
jgi:DNA polymerase I-like protein with 3'-5' exonuclease and polymerase domains|tara:strand:+ start:7037 stop:9082 length:2046 start_codon:yes stop_codon:yes gene_type:complete